MARVKPRGQSHFTARSKLGVCVDSGYRHYIHSCYPVSCTKHEISIRISNLFLAFAIVRKERKVRQTSENNCIFLLKVKINAKTLMTFFHFYDHIV